MRTRQGKRSTSTSVPVTIDSESKTETLSEITRLSLENDRLASGLVRLNAENARLTVENEGVYALRVELLMVKEKLSRTKEELASKNEGVLLSTPGEPAPADSDHHHRDEISKVKEELSKNVKVVEGQRDKIAELQAEIKELECLGGAGRHKVQGGERLAIDALPKMIKDEVLAALRGELVMVNEELSSFKEKLSKHVEEKLPSDLTSKHQRAENMIEQQRNELGVLREEIKRLTALNDQMGVGLRRLSMVNAELKRVRESLWKERNTIIFQGIEISALREEQSRLQYANDRLEAGNADLKIKNRRLSENLSTILTEGASKVELQISNAELKLENRVLNEKLSAFQREEAEKTELKERGGGLKQKAGGTGTEEGQAHEPEAGILPLLVKTCDRDNAVAESKELLDMIGASPGGESAAVGRQEVMDTSAETVEDEIQTMGTKNNIPGTTSDEALKDSGGPKGDIPEKMEEDLEDCLTLKDWEEVSVPAAEEDEEEEELSKETTRIHTATTSSNIQSSNQPSGVTAQLDQEISAPPAAEGTLAEMAVEAKETMLMSVNLIEVARDDEFVGINVDSAAMKSKLHDQMEQTAYKAFERAECLSSGDLQKTTQQLEGNLASATMAGTTDALEEIDTSKSIAVNEEARTNTEEKGLPTRDNSLTHSTVRQNEVFKGRRLAGGLVTRSFHHRKRRFGLLQNGL